jgi:hypothetical protein
MFTERVMAHVYKRIYLKRIVAARLVKSGSGLGSM